MNTNLHSTPDAQTAVPQRVLIVTGDPLGEKLAGPAIRATSFARVLADEGHFVKVASLQSVTIDDDAFEAVSVTSPSQMEAQERWADVIVVQGNALVLFESLANTTKYLVIDVYDPMHLEQLEQGRGKSEADWNNSILGANAILNDQLIKGDFFLAASDRQLHFWTGALASLGRVNVLTYNQDLSLKSLIDVVPFGMDANFPEKTKPALRNVIPGIDDDSKIIIWAGGIYNWFDPETLVKAVEKVSRTHPEIVLFFMGTKHPHPGVPEMAVIERTRKLSEKLNLTNKNVFFNNSWVDYGDRHNFLIDADAGVSTHYEHIETVFSFRTRILDYLWAGLPIVSTRGDSFGELIEDKYLGETVPETSVEKLAAAIESVLFDEEASEQMRQNIAEVRQRFFWANAAKPLVDFCANPHYAKDRINISSDGTVSRPATPMQQKTFTRARVIRGVQVLFTQGPAVAIRAVKRQLG